jgi:hypothetical protein
MVGPGRAPSQNSSRRYPIIKGSKASNAWTPSNRVVWNLNLDINAVRLQTITESIQRPVPQDSPLVSLAQQGPEAVGWIIAVEPSVGNQWGEPSIGNYYDDQAKQASGNKRLAKGDACQRITQKRRQCEQGCAARSGTCAQAGCLAGQVQGWADR